MKKFVIIGVIVLIVLTGGFIFVKSRSSNTTLSTEIIPTPTEALPTITDDIKVNLTFGVNRQSVILKISGLTAEIESVEYELTYMTGAGLARGVLGKITSKGEKEITRDDIVLGTCSSGRCVYDTGVKSIDLSLKFNSSTGSKVFQKTYPLE